MTTIRTAHVHDVAPMVHLINDYAEQGVMIHRSMAELYEHLRDFWVAEREGSVVGVGGLRIMWSTIGEVYALAVHPDARGGGVGRQLVEAAVDNADALGLRQVFALTYERAFFERCGFAVADRMNLPQKVWGECVRCPKHDACDEIAMVRTLREPTAEELSAASPSVDTLQGPMPIPIPAVLKIDAEARNA